MRTGAIRAACVLAVAVVLGWVGVSPASASLLPDLGCPPGVTESKIPPTPEMPGRGWSAPLPAPDTPPTTDPFAEDSDTSIYEAYGLAGLRWDTYDLGCGGSLANPDAAADTSIANMGITAAIGVTATAGALAGVVYEPTWLAVFDQPLVELSAGLRDAFWTPLAPFALFAAGMVIIWASRRAAFGAAAASAVAVIAAVGIVAVTTTAPTQLGGAADTGITSTTGYINATLSGRDVAAADPEVEAIAPFVDEVLYPRWVAGTLGSSDSATATTFGPDLFRASAFTWAEAATVEADPDAADQLIEQKQQLWTRTAEAVKEADPDAYTYLTGARATRTSEAVAANLSVLVLLFPIFAFVLMVASFVLIRLVVMTAPVWATFALLPSAHGIMRGAATLLLAAVVNPVLAAAGATLTLRTTAMLVAPDAPVPLWLGLVLAGVVCVLAWVALKPFRRVWALFTGNPLGNARGEVQSDVRAGRRLVGKGAKFLAGSKVSAAMVADEVGEELDERREQQPAVSGERFTRTVPQVNLDAPPPVTPLPTPARRPETVGAPVPQAERGDRPTVLTRQADVDDAGFPAHRHDPAVDVSHDPPTPGPTVKAPAAFWDDAVQVDAASATTRHPVRVDRAAVDVGGDEAYVVYDYAQDALFAEPVTDDGVTA